MRIRPYHWSIAASIVISVLFFSWAPFGMVSQRELFFDTITQIGPKPQAPDIAVVDLAGFQNNKWRRGDLADVLRKIASAKPSAVAFDLLFSSDCAKGDPENKELAAAIKMLPATLGFLIGEGQNGVPRPRPPLATARPLRVPDIWFIDKTESACDVFEDAAKSSAASFLVGDSDARVRRVQAYAVVGDTAFPALAFEAVRLSSGDSAPPILGGVDLWLKMGRRTISLPEDGSIRFVASSRQTIAGRTIYAKDIMDGTSAVSLLSGKIVFVGSSAPALGGLRESASMPLEASVQIHADAATAVVSGVIPTRDYRFARYEAFYVLVAGVLLALATSRFPPVYTAVCGGAVILFSLAISLLVYSATAYLVDGFSVSLALAAVLTITVFFQFAHSRRTERFARSRFGQYLPQSVVSRYLEGSSLSGEERRVTALFTDIEGFSTLAQKLSPQDLVSLLDTYFTEVNETIAAAGGMVDKVVGDAVHALFNAPEDLDNHVDAAIRCAVAIHALTENMRHRPEFSTRGFGRTRIGIETGNAVIGEVGTGGKLDYTAHGDAINLAARLQEANKFLGTSICVGPAAAHETRIKLRGLGDHEIRGFNTLELFTVTLEE